MLYHGVDLRGETKLNSRFLSKSTLRKHFAFYAKECKVISLESYFSQPLAGGKPEICLTFDDGYRNNFTEVLPLLEEFGFNATFFVAAAQPTGREILWTDLLDLVALHHGRPFIWDGEKYYRNGRKSGEYISLRTAQPLKGIAKEASLAAILELEKLLLERADFMQDAAWKPYWELMNAEQLRELAGHPLVELGVHGSSHCSLGSMPLPTAVGELRDCKSWLETFVSEPIKALSWPSGSYSQELVEAASQLGLKRQLAVDFLHPKDAEDSRQAARLVVNPHISFLNQREAILKGSYL